MTKHLNVYVVTPSTIGTKKYVTFSRNSSFFIGAEFVDNWPNLRHNLTNNFDNSEDITPKKTSLIGKVEKTFIYLVKPI